MGRAAVGLGCAASIASASARSAAVRAGGGNNGGNEGIDSRRLRRGGASGNKAAGSAVAGVATDGVNGLRAAAQGKGRRVGHTVVKVLTGATQGWSVVAGVTNAARCSPSAAVTGNSVARASGAGAGGKGTVTGDARSPPAGDPDGTEPWSPGVGERLAAPVTAPCGLMVGTSVGDRGDDRRMALGGVCSEAGEGTR